MWRLCGQFHSQEAAESRIANIRQWFQVLDRNGDGTISCEELADPLIMMGITKDMETVRPRHDRQTRGGRSVLQPASGRHRRAAQAMKAVKTEVAFDRIQSALRCKCV